MKEHNINLVGRDGQPLTGTINFPAEPLRGYALFAHCFTCGKDLFAARQIARALAGRGIATVRFDFAGVGRNEANPSVAGFTADVADVVAVALHIGQHYGPVELLIGHSLGGAAVLQAAQELPRVAAVATLGAPFDPAHVAHLIPETAQAEIRQNGSAEVRLGARDLRVSHAFLDSIRHVNPELTLGSLRKALLVMHAPNDELVEIDNAGKIYAAAKHPKSFVSLDSADHLLTRADDALYAAEVISAWASRYLPASTEPNSPEDRTVVRETLAGKFQQQIYAEGFRLLADEPEQMGGDNTGPSPYGLLASALGACTSMTLRMYADRKKLPLEQVTVEVFHEKIHAEDCASCETTTGKVDRFTRKIFLKGNLRQVDQNKLLEIADKCPVHQTLERTNEIVTEISKPPITLEL